MSQLDALGVKAARRYVKHLVAADVAGAVLLNTKHAAYQTTPNVMTEFTLTLPHRVDVKVRFTHESLGKKLAKLFTHELQTGDSEFDREVFISTDTPEATRKLLEAEELRRAIWLTVSTGGPIEIADTTVRMTVFGEQDGDDAAVLTMVRALLAPSIP